MSNLVLLDCDYLCRRAFYTTGSLSYNGEGTGVAYGLFQSLLTLAKDFSRPRYVFCWDVGRPHRASLLSQYKATRRIKRREGTPFEKARERAYQTEVKALRREHLFAVGFRNVFWSGGYEADDLLAAQASYLEAVTDSKITIVTNDSDLLQTLTSRVSVWNPVKRELWTPDALLKRHGVTPQQWIDVKCIAGCSSDDIPGVSGVGEKTALRYVLGQLGANTTTHKKITDALPQLRANKKLVTLPFPETPFWNLESDCVTPTKWRSVCRQLGFRSLVLRGWEFT